MRIPQKNNIWQISTLISTPKNNIQNLSRSLSAQLITGNMNERIAYPKLLSKVVITGWSSQAEFLKYFFGFLMRRSILANCSPNQEDILHFNHPIVDEHTLSSLGEKLPESVLLIPA
jgi:hypothetical protein